MGRKARRGRMVSLKLTREQEAWFDRVKHTPYGTLPDAQILCGLIDRAMQQERE